MGVLATTGAGTDDPDTHTPWKYTASPVPIPGVNIEVVFGTAFIDGARPITRAPIPYFGYRVVYSLMLYFIIKFGLLIRWC